MEWCAKCWEDGRTVEAVRDDLCASCSAEEPIITPMPTRTPEQMEAMKFMKDALEGQMNVYTLRKEIYFAGGHAVFEFSRKELLELDDEQRLMWLNWCLEG